MTARRLALCFPALALLAVGCDRDVEEPVANADAPPMDDAEAPSADDAPDDPDEPGGDDSDATPNEDEEDGAGYAIRGRTVTATGADAVPTHSRGVAQLPQATAENGCPFDPTSDPCNAAVCQEDPSSEDCKDIIEAYCEMHPGDPACGPDGLPEDPPPPDGEPRGEDPPPDGETWACAEDPSWPPCEVCLDPAASDDDCGAAWNEHCDEHPGDEWCEGDDDEPEAVYMPTSLSVLVQQVEFSLDAQGCTDPVLVGMPDEPHYVDFADAPELVDAVLPPEGMYGCVIITMSDHIQWSVDGDNPCAGTHVQDVSGDEGVEETVRLYLSTSGDSDRDGNDAFEAPGLYLDGALEVGAGIVGSDFVVSFPEGVWYRPDRDEVCEIQKPEFAFQTTYAE